MNARCESALVGSTLRCSGASSCAQIELVVQVAGAFRKHGAEQIEIRADGLGPRRQPGREALRQIAGRRVPRGVEAAGYWRSASPETADGQRADVDDVESRARPNLESEFYRWHGRV